MEFYLKTKEECDKICKQTDSFYCADRVVEGVNVAIYDYRSASTSDFENFKAWELRGLCFVEQLDGTWQRNLLMNKFMNINQTKGKSISWMYDDVKDKKITRVQNKEDGSIISAVMFPNGKVRMKSKTSFESEQAKMAQDVYNNNENLQYFLNDLNSKNLTPIFELVGYENTIVLNYNVPYELVLLQTRREDGTYLEKSEMVSLAENFNIKCTEDFDVSMMNLDTLLELKESLQEDIEGWIVTFEDGQMAKIKTNHYLSMHELIGPDAWRENLLIKTILDGNIDDVITQLVSGEKRDKIIDINEKVNKYFNHQVKEFIYLRNVFHEKYKKDRKKFAIDYAQKHPMFGGVIKSLNVEEDKIEKFAETSVKEYIERVTNSLSKAKEFVASL